MISTVPPELAERILALCHFKDVVAFAQTCRGAYALVCRSSDQYLWRNLFLGFPFDDPRLSSQSQGGGGPGSSSAGGGSGPLIHETKVADWCTKLQRRVRAERIAKHDGDRRECVSVLLECISEAAPSCGGGGGGGGVARGTGSGSESESAESGRSHNLLWVTKVLTLEESPWIERFLRLEQLESPSPTQHLSSDVDKLRAHLALSLDRGDGAGADAPESLRILRRMSRAHVYDLRNYARETHWGPFTHDGDDVNWTHVNAIVTVITMNLRDFNVHWPREFKPLAMVHGLEACRPYSAAGAFNRSPLDWAGVEGHWMRIVCFCDYRDLIRFNNSGWKPDFFDDKYQEASRLLRLDLRLISVESDPGVLEKSPDPSRPPITFGGTMRGFNSDEVLNREVRGIVRVMKDGNIRWSFVSIYNHHDQWSSEGVQIGGVCSAAGVVGAWSGAHHKQGDPSGPFWLFKAQDTQ